MPTARSLWVTGLSRGLRLAGLLSVTASLSSSTANKRAMMNLYSTSSTSCMLRAGIVRCSPGFVLSSGGSTCSSIDGSRVATRVSKAHDFAHPAARCHMRSSEATPKRWIIPDNGKSRHWSSHRLSTVNDQLVGSTSFGGVRRSSAVAATSLSSRRGGGEATEQGAVGVNAGHRHGFKVNLLDMSHEEVGLFLKSIGEPKYRADQVLKWMYDGGALSFDDMTNLPKALRLKLDEVATLGVLEVAAQQTSKDGTRKRAYRLADGQLIESVLMPYSDGRRTACISSQAGCAMGCVFCATGQMGFKRQLTSSEIFEQAYRFSQELTARGERLSNVVFMGMGEPLANYNTVMEAVRRINAELGIGARHITISTVGLVPRILRLSQEDIQVKLAVSLHSSNDAERSALLPANRRFPLGELMLACKEYADVTGRRVTFEWALIHGENDTVEVAAELGRLLRPLKGMCHVNIIPLNPTAGYDGGPALAEAVDQFVSVLAHYGVPATPRVRRGIDIDAGCGQLTTKMEQEGVLGRGI